MAEIFTPEIGIVPVHPIMPREREGLLNPPEKGTGIRVTSGETTIVGFFVDAHDSRGIYIGIPTDSYYEHLFSAYLEGGWQIEILTEDEYQAAISHLQDQYRTYWGTPSEKRGRGRTL